MEERLRQHIKQNINKLVGFTDYRPLMNACLVDNLLTREMELYIEKIDRNSGDFERECHKRLFFELTRRGPTAYKRIIEILKNLEYEKAYKILEYPGDNEDDYVPRTNNQQQRRTQSQPQQNNPTHNSNLRTNSIAAVNDENENNVEFAEYAQEIPNEYKFVVKKSTKIHESSDLESYSAKSRNRGVILIVNIIDVKGQEKREGSEFDKFKLVHLYREIGFKVYAYDNLTRKQFENILEKVTQSQVAGEADIFQLVLMTHGENQDKTQMCSFSDGSVMKEDEILSYLQNNKCQNLYGKPKICIFQFCRGPRLEQSQRANRLQHDSIRTRMIEPTYTDLLICYTTLPGFLSNRERDRGAWYIQNFCDIMAECAHNQNFEEIIKKTNAMTTRQRGEEDNRMQTPNFTNYGFNSILFMNPGFYENMNSS